MPGLTADLSHTCEQTAIRHSIFGQLGFVQSYTLCPEGSGRPFKLL
jgi:hypothetical protein